MKRLLLVALAALLPLAACSAASRNPSPSAHAVRRDAHFISLEEVESARHANAYDLVRALRPGWLTRRGVKSIGSDGDVVVYLDHTRLGGPDSLRGIPAQDVAAIRHLSGTDAQQRFGEGHWHGAIVVVTR